MKNRRLLLTSVAFIALFCIGGTFAFFTYNSVERKYAKANHLFNNGQTEKAVKLYKELADNGDIKSKTRLGLLYIENDSVPFDEIGLKYLEEAAPYDTVALKKVLMIYDSDGKWKGHEIKKNLEKAQNYANYAVKHNIVLSEAYLTLGIVAQAMNNGDKQFYFWNKLASVDKAGGNLNLGWMFLEGINCEVNHSKAFNYFQKAYDADPTDGFTLYYLGLCYYHGYGVEKYTEKGMEYYKKAADLGIEEAQDELGKIELSNK